MASQSEGIQRLLEAEKEAQKDVDAARRQKAKKLKQAKDEAKAEIQIFTKEREAQFKEKEAAIMGGKNDLQQNINAQTQQKIAEMSVRVADRQDDVIHKLVQSVQNVVPELPRNYGMNQGS